VEEDRPEEDVDEDPVEELDEPSDEEGELDADLPFIFFFLVPGFLDDELSLCFFFESVLFVLSSFSLLDLPLLPRGFLSKEVKLRTGRWRGDGLRLLRLLLRLLLRPTPSSRSRL